MSANFFTLPRVPRLHILHARSLSRASCAAADSDASRVELTFVLPLRQARLRGATGTLLIVT